MEEPIWFSVRVFLSIIYTHVMRTSSVPGSLLPAKDARMEWFSHLSQASELIQLIRNFAKRDRILLDRPSDVTIHLCILVT